MTEDQNLAQEAIDFFKEHTVVELTKFSLTGPEIAINPIFASEYKMSGSAYKTIAAESSLLDCELHKLKTAIQIVAFDLVAVKAKAAVSHLNAIAAN